MDEGTATAVVAAVWALVSLGTTTTTTTSRPPLPKPPARARLALDAAALLAGLRPGILLDYGGPAFQDEAGLAAFAADLTSLMRKSSSSSTVRLARLGPPMTPSPTDDGFAADPAYFLVAVPLRPASVPWPVTLAAGGVVWSEDEHALAPALSATATALHGAAAAADPPATLDIQAPSTPPEAVAAWLLGYPCALVRGGGSGAPAPSTSSLSSATLVALRARPPPALTAALAAASWPLPAGVMEGDDGRVDVCSFALPPGGPPEGEWLEGGWIERVRAQAVGTGWDGVTTRTGSMGPGGLAV